MMADVKGVGLIGCGNIGVQHLPAWMSALDGFAVVAVADPTPARLTIGQLAAGLRSEDAYHDYRDLLRRDDIDVVDVCVPPHVRRDVVVAAARAGKHILAEKPLATIPADAAVMIEAALTAGVTLGIVHNYLFQPEIVKAMDIIVSGGIGEVEVVIINHLGIIDYPGAAEYRPTWRHDAAQSGGGVLMDLIHLVYLAEAFLCRPIERVSAYVNVRQRKSSVEDIAACRFETPDSVALVNVGWGVGPGGVEISGTDGRLAIRYEDGGTFTPFREMVLSDHRGSRAVDTPLGEHPMELVIRDFAESLTAGRPSAATGEQGLRFLEATVAAYQSAATGCTVGLPLDPTGPVFLHGLSGLRDLDLPNWTPVRRKEIFGVTAGSSAAPAVARSHGARR